MSARAAKSRTSKVVAKAVPKQGGKRAAGHTRAGAAAGSRDTRAQELPPVGAAAEWVATAELVPWAGNPKKATKAEIMGVAASIREFGFGAPLVARLANNELIAGHTRLQAARVVGLKHLPVRFLDLDERKAHVLALADNELGADWQGDLLDEHLKLLSAEERLLAGFVDKAPMPDGEDNAPPVPKKAKSKLGERYELGPHVLVCGDSTAADSWERLLGSELVDLVWTDPPFGVAYEGGVSRDPRRAPRGKSGGATIQNDAMSVADLTVFLRSAFALAAHRCAPGSVWYVKAPAGPASLAFATVLTELDAWRQTLSWVKSAFVFGRSDYHYRHEIIFYGWLPGAAHHAVPDRKQDSVWEFDRNSHSRKSGAVEHPTMTPVPLIERAITNSSRQDNIVADLFGGSGSTLIACARTGRRARLIELDPLYCDVIRKRWGDFARTAGVELGSGAL